MGNLTNLLKLDKIVWFFVVMFFIYKVIVEQLKHTFHSFFRNGRKLNSKIEFTHCFTLSKSLAFTYSFNISGHCLA